VTRVEFRLLGPVEVVGETGPLAVRGTRNLSLVAALLLEANQVVPIDRLVTSAWGDDPPTTAPTQVRNRMSAMRRLLPRPDGTDMITTRGSGYLIHVGEEQLDAQRFDRLVAHAEALVGAGEPDQAAAVLAEALALWRGPALDALRSPPLAAAAQRLEEARVRAVETRIELDLAAGRHDRLLPELTALTEAQPYRERLREHLMLALYRAGRQAEALEVFRRTRALLAEQLAVEPGPALQRLHESILRGEVQLTGSVRVVTAPVPQQLPGDVPGFAGRGDQIAELDGLLAADSPVALLTGTAGVGKTALAVHWARRVAHRFPDGQLYVNLHGFDLVGAPSSPAEAIRRFLDALAVPPHRIPADLDAQAALYRSVLAGRRVLVLLDNARDADQVRPLLPGTPTTLTVVTSRDQLIGLVATEGARPVTVDLLSTGQARELLNRRLGPDRVGASPRAADDVIARCARLPLALAIVAARAATHPRFPLATLADELGDTRTRLDALRGGDPATDLRTVFSWSYWRLSFPAARLFRLLGLHRGPDVAVPAVASLGGLPPAGARRLLAELAEAHLLTEHVPGRYACHDLLRAYAAELAHAHDPPADRQAALHRMLDHYLHTAQAAARLLDPHLDHTELEPALDGVTVVELADRCQAWTWLTAERPALLAAVRQGTAVGLDAYTCQIAWTLPTFLYRRGLWHEQVDVQAAALRAAQRLANPAWQAYAHRRLGIAHAPLGHSYEAYAQLHRALSRYRALGDRTGQAHTHHDLSIVYERQGRHREALEQARRALDLFQLTGHPARQAFCLNAVGWYHALLAEYPQALTACREALALNQATRNRSGEAHTWDSLGYAHHHLSRHAEAADCYQRALALFRELGNRYAESETLVHLGDTHLAAGGPDAARTAWHRALDILTCLGDPDAEAVQARIDRLDHQLAVPAAT
jgi:DNA-binding SARP family transcriptional activator